MRNTSHVADIAKNLAGAQGVKIFTEQLIFIPECMSLSHVHTHTHTHKHLCAPINTRYTHTIYTHVYTHPPTGTPHSHIYTLTHAAQQDAFTSKGRVWEDTDYEKDFWEEKGKKDTASAKAVSAVEDALKNSAKVASHQKGSSLQMAALVEQVKLETNQAVQRQKKGGKSAALQAAAVAVAATEQIVLKLQASIDQAHNQKKPPPPTPSMAEIHTAAEAAVKVLLAKMKVDAASYKESFVYPPRRFILEEHFVFVKDPHWYDVHINER